MPNQANPNGWTTIDTSTEDHPRAGDTHGANMHSIASYDARYRAERRARIAQRNALRVAYRDLECAGMECEPCELTDEDRAWFQRPIRGTL